MKPRTKSDVVNRLAKLQGQVRGLAAMVEDERDPADILTLVSAIRAALDGVGTVVLTEQVESALARAPGVGDLSADEIYDRTERVKKALARFVS